MCFRRAASKTLFRSVLLTTSSSKVAWQKLVQLERFLTGFGSLDWAKRPLQPLFKSFHDLDLVNGQFEMRFVHDMRHDDNDDASPRVLLSLGGSLSLIQGDLGWLSLIHGDASSAVPHTGRCRLAVVPLLG